MAPIFQCFIDTITPLNLVLTREYLYQVNRISIAGKNVLRVPPERHQYDCATVNGAAIALGFDDEVHIIGIHVK